MQLIATEESYLDQIKQLVEIFYNPLMELKILSEKKGTEIFSNISTIYSLNKIFLSELKNKMSKQQSIGLAFLESVIVAPILTTLICLLLQHPVSIHETLFRIYQQL